MMHRALPLRLCLMALCVAGGIACNPANPNTLRIVGNVVAANKQGSLCYASAGAQIRVAGTLDLAVAKEYPFYAQVENLLLDTKTVSGNSYESLRGDASTITIKSAIISVELSRGTSTAKTPFYGDAATVLTGGKKDKLVTSWEVPASAVLIGSSTSIVPFSLIPGDLTIGADWQARWRAFAKANASTNGYSYTQRAIVKVALQGTTGDGTVVLSEDLTYPVNLCWGCLLSVPAPTPSTDVIDPYAGCSTFVSGSDVPCSPGADDYVECGRYCAMCLVAKTNSPQQQPCDDKFCPGLQ